LRHHWPTTQAPARSSTRPLTHAANARTACCARQTKEAAAAAEADASAKRQREAEEAAEAEAEAKRIKKIETTKDVEFLRAEALKARRASLLA
jgi:hypothetical protein